MQKYIKKFKRMHKELNNKKINNAIKKWAKHLTFFQRRYTNSHQTY